MKSSSDKLDVALSGLSTLKPSNGSSATLDKAIVYLEAHSESQSDTNDVDHALLVRKIDRHMVPIALAAYTLQFLDKLDLNYAAVMGLNKDLGLVGNDFNNAASAMYIADLIAELPTGYIVQKVRPGKWLGFNIILWGVVTACTAAIKNYHALVATRPSGMWYTKSEAILRFSIWYCRLGIAQMLGFQQVTHEALSGWRIMFLVLGCVTAAAGLWAVSYMPDSPMDVSWLTEAEKRVAIQRVATSLTSGVISFYSTTLIRNFGFSSARSALLNMPTYLSHRYDSRALCMSVFCMFAATGSGLMSFLPASHRAGLLAGVYLVNMQTVTLFLVFCLTTANVAGQTKRVAANALISGAFSVGNIIGPQLFKAKDAPQFIPANVILLVTEIVTGSIAAALRIYYGWQNKIRDAAEKRGAEGSCEY
ncbi:major facilitator superfamily domain-containing protein [Mycena crocata]|nr:major facilitator superfamily domain-containing protein [Mycena crocata]